MSRTKKFVLKHEFVNISSMKEGDRQVSKSEEHFNIPWLSFIFHSKGRIGFAIQCNKRNEDGVWAIQTEFEMKVLASPKNILTEKSTLRFGSTSKTNALGWVGLMDWQEFKRKYVVKDRVTIEAHVEIIKMTGSARQKLRNFDKAINDLSDAVLIVEEEKFHVTKLFLSAQSDYFKLLFTRRSKRTNKTGITLADIKPWDFQNFLEALHLEPAIDDETVNGILEIADMCHTEAVVNKCEEFLLKESEKPMKEKLELSAEYDLKRLKARCLEMVKSIADVRSILPQNINEIGSPLAKLLLKKCVTI